MNFNQAKTLNVTLTIPQTSWENVADKNRLMWEAFGRYIGPNTDATVDITITPLKKK